MDINKTLDQLENNIWGEPQYSSYLVKECHRLRKVQLKDFSPADLRVMIGQSISLKYLIPLALDILENDPFIDAYYFDGDLLTVVLTSSKEYWENMPIERERLKNIVTSITDSKYKNQLIIEAISVHDKKIF